MTWNLKWFPGGRPSASPEDEGRQIAQAAATLREARPDVLVLQEVKSLDAVETLLKAAHLPMEVHICSRFAQGQHGGLAGQQIAIASRFSASMAWSETWQRGWAGAPRGYAYARLDIGGRSVHVYGLHLKSNLGADPALNASKREDAVEQLMRHVEAQVAQSRSDFVIVGGDFNTSLEAPPMKGERTVKILPERGFFSPFEGVPAADRVTAPGHDRYPDACFDYFFIRGLGRPVAWVMRDQPASDHWPVVVEVRVPAVQATVEPPPPPTAASRGGGR